VDVELALARVLVHLTYDTHVPAEAIERLSKALSSVAGADVTLRRPSNRQHGDYATNVALQSAPRQGRPPRELAAELTERAVTLPDVERAEVAGPGFVNLWLANEWYGDALEEILDRDTDYGAGSPAERERIQVELVSANPTGPITVASARNGAYGDAVARLLEFAGHEVAREYYYNDAGRQMELFRDSVEARRRGEEPPEDGYRGAYVDELAEVPGDPVAAMLEEIERTLEQFRIHFDSWARQSELEGRLPEILRRLDTYEKDGAVWVQSTKYGDERDRVLIRSAERGGRPTYEAADIAYLADKLDRGFERVMYVLGADHQDVRGWYQVVARMLGYDAEVEVLLYQLVHLTKGGEQTKMSKRRGDVVFLDELLEEIGVDAARWYLVSRGRDQTIEIDVDLAAEKTQKNPVYYVQYAHARIAGILRNAGDAVISAAVPPGLADEEKNLIKRLVEFPALVAEATDRRGPHALPYYAIQVADDFHRFYHERRVLGSEEEAFRLGLVRAAQTVIARSLDLIGVEAPERM
jgi:arginyl-tRNA synthetase